MADIKTTLQMSGSIINHPYSRDKVESCVKKALFTLHSYYIYIIIYIAVRTPF